MGSTAKSKLVAPTKGLDARVSKIAGVSFDAINSAIHAALKEKYPPPEGGDGCCSVAEGPWLRDVFDDVAVYCYDGKLYRVGYTFNAGTATLSGEPEEVQVTYAPISAAPPSTPDELARANTQKGRQIIAKKFDDLMDRIASRR